MVLLQGRFCLRGVVMAWLIEQAGSKNPIASFARVTTGWQRIRPCPLLSLALLWLAPWLLSGCGGGTKPPAPAAPVAPPPVAIKTVKPAAPEPAENPPGEAAPVEGEATAGPAMAPPGEHPANVFDFVAPGSVNSVTSSTPLPHEVDQFVISQVADQAGATSFVVTEIPATSETGSSIDPSGNPANLQGNRLPIGFMPVPGTGLSPDGWPRRIICQYDGSLMAYIPPGPARLGSNDGPANARPEATVLLDGYYINVFETTVAEYKRYRDEMKAKNKNSFAAINETADPRQPVLGIPWGVASAYAKWSGRDLPTEAEFEKAARGPDGFRAPWGNTRAIWPEPRTTKTLANVGKFSSDQSIYGIYDLAGNAHEWVADWHDDNSHAEAAKSRDGVKNWTGAKKPKITSQHTVKGCLSDWDVTAREGRLMTDKFPDVGFRTVLRVGPGNAGPPPAATPPNTPNTKPANPNRPPNPPRNNAF
ncbi:Serine/threonine-protein kinase pkn1 [Planctopirus ephydatiae]|uniref:Serine/threonine-protein kinase pkn1 n=2 Tax=Planctopirus ephydatiae TaxID=2528019 RepID=A0A518GKB0_9PLAN|nr:Serine/threonine-protein kinase pkn1 [Planctopirus ephydatiae]